MTRYLKLLSGETGHDVSFCDDAMTILTQYQWPGNSRALCSLAELEKKAIIKAGQYYHGKPG